MTAIVVIVVLAAVVGIVWAFTVRWLFTRSPQTRAEFWRWAQQSVFAAFCVGVFGAFLIALFAWVWAAITAQGGLIGRP